MTLTIPSAPLVVTYCHCADCKRVTGAPVAAFAAFAQADLTLSPDPGPPVSHAPGVKRWFCAACGSPLAAQYDYLPGQIYVPLGVLDQADQLQPSLHCHADAALPWLQIDDDLCRQTASGRDALQSKMPSE